MRYPKNTRSRVLKIKSFVPIWYARFWQYYYRYKSWALTAVYKYKLILIALSLSFLIAISWLIAQRATPLIENRNDNNGEDQEQLFENDMARTTYYQLNPGWTDVARRGVVHCLSFSRRYAGQGDYEVSGMALNAILSINGAYINAKGTRPGLKSTSYVRANSR